jgi:hypothetical protein
VLKKPFIGGYHDKSSGKEFHHASAQTLPKFRPDDGVRHNQLQLLIMLYIMYNERLLDFKEIHKHLNYEIVTSKYQWMLQHK